MIAPTDIKPKHRSLDGNGINSLLENGCFSYSYANVPLSWCSILYLYSNLPQSSAPAGSAPSLPIHSVKYINKHCSRLIKPFHKLDNRIKLGLPLLLPLPPTATITTCKSNTTSSLVAEEQESINVNISFDYEWTACA